MPTRRRSSSRPALESEPAIDPDDTLVLLFMCCHPALSPSSAIALTLRAVGGLTTAEIAKAFLVPESTMAQRISRAKQTIKKSGVPFGLPDAGGACDPVELGPARSLPDLQRRLQRELRTRAPASRPLERGDPADTRRPPAPARRRRGRGPPGADATDRRPPSRRGADPTASSSRSTSRTARSGTAPGDRRGRRAGRARPCAGDRSASTSCRRRSRRSTTRPPRAEDTDWPQILALYSVLKRISDNPMVDAQPRDRDRHGARPERGARAAESARP